MQILYIMQIKKDVHLKTPAFRFDRSLQYNTEIINVIIF